MSIITSAHSCSGLVLKLRIYYQCLGKSLGMHNLLRTNENTLSQILLSQGNHYQQFDEYASLNIIKVIYNYSGELNRFSLPGIIISLYLQHNAKPPPIHRINISTSFLQIHPGHKWSLVPCIFDSTLDGVHLPISLTIHEQQGSFFYS